MKVLFAIVLFIILIILPKWVSVAIVVTLGFVVLNRYLGNSVANNGGSKWSERFAS